jgi:hypothetical protein
MGRSKKTSTDTAILVDKTIAPLITAHGTLTECRAPKFLVDPLEGPSMRQCGSDWNLGHDPDFQH